MSLLPVTEVVVIFVVVCLLVGVAVVFARRRYLSANGGVFDCELRAVSPERTGSWADGLAHYDASSLEWYRVLSLSFRPRVVVRRRGAVLLDHRLASPQEAPALFAGHRVVRLQVVTSSGEARIWELGMAQESLLGLMSWLEAEPPGGASYQEFD